MSFSEKELESRSKEISKNVLLVFVPIAVIFAIVFSIQNNSLEFNKNKYFKSRDVQLSGLITRKRQEGDYYRAARLIFLNSGRKEQIPNEIYDNIEIGDSVVKKKGQDSTYFYLKSGKILTADYNKFLRQKYQQLLAKSNK